MRRRLRAGRAAADAVAIAAVSVAAAALAIGWQARVRDAQPKAPKAEAWGHVRERFPMPEPFAMGQGVDGAMLDALIDAHPFSPERRRTAKPSEDAPPPPPKAPPAKFLYKGRVTMGATQRAILEELTAKKTYFLQVGQEVAGFKVIDIQESRVLLSDQKTQEQVTVMLAQPESAASAP